MQTQQHDTDEALRDRAVQLLRKKSEFRAHLLAYVLINGFLVGIWAVTGAKFLLARLPDHGLGHRRGVQRLGRVPASGSNRGADPPGDGVAPPA
jgi:hypothetical protein